jgi:hypothetical protein
VLNSSLFIPRQVADSAAGANPNVIFRCDRDGIDMVIDHARIGVKVLPMLAIEARQALFCPKPEGAIFFLSYGIDYGALKAKGLIYVDPLLIDKMADASPPSASPDGLITLIDLDGKYIAGVVGGLSTREYPKILVL